MQTTLLLLSAITVLAAAIAPAAAADDAKTVADLDTRFQLATKNNDAATIAGILHDDMVLVIGRGVVVTKKELVDAAANQTTIWEQQDEEPGSQTVRLYGPDTAIVTAKLWLKGKDRRPVLRPQALVQRHICKDAAGLEIRLWPVLDRATERALKALFRPGPRKAKVG